MAAGEIAESCVQRMLELLGPVDVLIDGASSCYRDPVHRGELPADTDKRCPPDDALAEPACEWNRHHRQRVSLAKRGLVLTACA